MTATPPPVPPAPVGPPASGTLESSTPTPQQLAGTEKGRKTHTHTRYSLLRKNSLACQCESRLARVSPSSRFSGHHRPSVTEIRLIRLESTGRVSRAEAREVPGEVGPEFRYVYGPTCTYTPHAQI